MTGSGAVIVDVLFCQFDGVFELSRRFEEHIRWHELEGILRHSKWIQ